MKIIREAIGRLKADKDKFLVGAFCREQADLTPSQFADFYKCGCFPIERKEGFVLTWPLYREIVPLAFYLPRSMERNNRQHEWLFTTNQDFGRVLDECMRPRASDAPDYFWIGERSKRNLVELHGKGVAHSVEIYDRSGRTMHGGAIGLKFNGLFISLSLFSQWDGAGNAAALALQGVLCRRGFVMHDAIMPSSTSRRLGGDMVNGQYASSRRRIAVAPEKNLVFPELHAKLPILEYIEPLLTKAQDDGRTFPRQERDASKEQNGSQARQNLRQAGTRNRRGRQAGPS
jgi:leucyl/phenylalanyl-tRNA--protein transferase